MQHELLILFTVLAAVFHPYSFSQRTINEWNKLSADCVHSSRINMFNNRIDNYLLDKEEQDIRFVHVDSR